MLIKKPLLFAAPCSLSVEPANVCNLKCIECPTGQEMLTRPKGFININLYKNIINELSPYIIYHMLYFQGEPFMHPDIFSLIQYAKKKRIYTTTSSNGHFFDDTTAEKVVKSRLDRIIISMDGLSQETYEKYRVNGNLNKVIDGINKINKWKQHLNSKKPYIVLQFLVLKYNECEMNMFKKKAKELKVNKIVFKTCQFYNQKNMEVMLPDNKRFSRYIFRDKKYLLKRRLRNHCNRIWSTGIITFDGKVVPCCYDKDASYLMGNINSSTFSSIWKNENFQMFRKKILKNKKSIPICNNCPE